MEQTYALSAHITLIAGELNIRPAQVQRTGELLADQATVPFISRYRKEATGNLDEVAIAAVKDRLQRLEALEKRRSTILETIAEQGKLTDQLAARIRGSFDSRELEDIYLPYKPKRRTRGTIARENGLEPLAEKLLEQGSSDPHELAREFLSEKISDTDTALAGARDIIAELVNEDSISRGQLRAHYAKAAAISSKQATGKAAKEKAAAAPEQAAKYRDYFEWSEPLKRCPAHRFLALQRGAREGFLSLSVAPEEQRAVQLLQQRHVKQHNPCGRQVADAVEDAYKRLLAPSLENEFLAGAKESADRESIAVFAENLRQLLLSPPLGPKRVLAIDPGFRTGCKLVCLDEQGSLLTHEVMYPHPPQNKTSEARQQLQRLIRDYRIAAVAIGNGTAGRESEELLRSLNAADTGPQGGSAAEVYMVNEDGASVYSASTLARKEFPGHDVTVRGAVSIGRRLMDPLSELVKIDPKSIGVGQYQHDVDQKLLKSGLDGVVESCVNLVGVNVNTASAPLLQYVSGLGPKLAAAVVSYRSEHGPFASRSALKKIPGMGPKAFQQSAGFLRIPNAKNPLDASAVHPESYPVVRQMAADQNCSVAQLMTDPERRRALKPEDYVNEAVGLPTLRDILAELEKPGRDPRDAIEEFSFDANVHSIDDLQPGQVLPGIVTNITRFGAFVDLGVKQDGLIHVSQMADRYVRDPNEVVKLQQHLQVRVLEVDTERRRIALSLKSS
ncbi:MAG: RNA-binding transcriptional accessory protein [Spirochaetaceae bacterium]|nr:RNA-binding transcriptional accessory protein [Spirochaetaceae bacterium]MCF7951790.1 RNA-binding transcriptional accessory protein [Spirochaetaceae bacterium]